MEVPRLKSLHKNKLFHALLLGILFAVTIWSVFRGEDFHEVLYFLKTADLKYILPCFLCALLFIGGEAVNLYYLFKVLGTKVRISHCWLYSFIGFFYGCITPSASGGQPMQVLAMRKDAIPVPVATVVLAIIAIAYKSVLVIIGLCVLTLRPPVIMLHIGNTEGLIYLGLILNVICLAALIMIVFVPSTVRRLAEKIISLISRIRPFRHPEKVMHKLDDLFSQYAGAADFYRNNKHVIFNVLVITFLQRCSQFAVTWLTYCAFDLADSGPFTIITLQSLISVATDMLPLPGGMGANENVFIEIFRNIFGDDRVLPAMVISRGISYYTQLLISGIMTIAATFLIVDRRNIHDSLT